MFRTGPGGIARRALKAVATVAASSALVLAAAGTGNAGISIEAGTDTMEGTVAFSTWSFTHSGDGAGGFSTIHSHSPVRSGFVSMRNDGFSSVGRMLNLGSAASNFHACETDVWIDPAVDADTFNIEVLDPATFRYVALNTVHLNPASSFTNVGVGWNTGSGPVNVLFRVSIIGRNGVTVASWVDDLHYLCTV